jgi:hypothetical protein
LTPRRAATGATVCCDLAGFASLQVTSDMIPALRVKPGPDVGASYPVSLLKHADEQTVVGFGAVLHAIRDHGLIGTVFTDWGVLAAPRFLGRSALAVALQRYRLEGAWGISPHLIPHRSLHSISGTVSHALTIHGPNFGVSGGLNAADEGLLVAATLLAGNDLPGVWLVLTGYNPEPIPEGPEGPAPAAAPTAAVPVCRALALALVAARPGSQQFKLHISPGSMVSGAEDEVDAAAPLFYFESLLDELEKPAPGGGWRLHCGGGVELKRSGADAEN